MNAHIHITIAPLSTLCSVPHASVLSAVVSVILRHDFWRVYPSQQTIKSSSFLFFSLSVWSDSVDKLHFNRFLELSSLNRYPLAEQKSSSSAFISSRLLSHPFCLINQPHITTWDWPSLSASLSCSPALWSATSRHLSGRNQLTVTECYPRQTTHWRTRRQRAGTGKAKSYRKSVWSLAL